MRFYLIPISLILFLLPVDGGSRFETLNKQFNKVRNLEKGRHSPEYKEDGDTKGEPSSKTHLSSAQAHRIATLFGGIGPILNPPNLPLMDKTSKSASKSHISKRSADEPIGNKLQYRLGPEQIHLSYGDDPTEMVVVWSTPKQGDSKVHYGMSPSDLEQVESGSVSRLVDGNDMGVQWIHRVKLKNLVPGSQYFYKVATEEEESEVFDFFTMKDGTDWAPTILIYGDMGRNAGAPALRLLNRAAKRRSADVIVHVGDFAYDFHSDGGKVGDDFMNRIQSIAAKIPYMTTPGNHEIAFNFSHYRTRFSMPQSPWPIPLNKMWYSFDIANIHFVSYSTEVYFTDTSIKDQLDWLEQDLISANRNRAARPWIIAYGHRPMYCSVVFCEASDREVYNDLEELFYKYGVDLIVEAHTHSYERLWPVYKGKVSQYSYKDPTAPVHVIVGTAGCNHNDGVCFTPIFEPKGPWSAVRSWLPGLYGIGKLFAANNTHLHFQQQLALTGQIQDEFWLVQHHHGPFPT